MMDVPGAGGPVVEVTPPAVPMPPKRAFDSSGIELTTGTASVKLSNVSVSVNNGALEVI